MNNKRRSVLRKIIEKLRKIQIESGCIISQEQIDELCAIKDALEYVLSDEQYSLDSIPENLQGSYKYQKSESACDNIEDAIDLLSDAIDDDTEKNIDDAINHIYDAMS